MLRAMRNGLLANGIEGIVCLSIFSFFDLVRDAYRYLSFSFECSSKEAKEAV